MINVIINFHCTEQEKSEYRTQIICNAIYGICPKMLTFRVHESIHAIEQNMNCTSVKICLSVMNDAIVYPGVSHFVLK